jgi:hypothetical protein
MGQEVHDPALSPPGNHYLALGVEQPVRQHAKQPQALVDAVEQAGGVGFIAHPFEVPAPLIGVPAFPWQAWEVNGFAGIELWNYLSELKGFVTSRRRALAAVFMPDLFIQGPFPETLERWDRLLATGRKVVAIGGADAHANVYAMGPVRRRVFPYERMFRAVNTHLLLGAPLADDVREGRRQVLDALRCGHAFVANERLGSGRGFRFEATPLGRAGEHGTAQGTTASGRDTVSMGDTVVLDGKVAFRVVTPLKASIRLLCDGRDVARASGCALNFETRTPGVYRVEVHRRHGLRKRGWLFSNPIYVRSHTEACR